MTTARILTEAADDGNTWSRARPLPASRQRPFGAPVSLLRASANRAAHRRQIS
jgi:hypothetical protein